MTVFYTICPGGPPLARNGSAPTPHTPRQMIYPMQAWPGSCRTCSYSLAGIIQQLIRSGTGHLADQLDHFILLVRASPFGVVEGLLHEQARRCYLTDNIE
ncbi:hypothetical protein BDW75DRAFT_200227 [Aspergillus navahoensis]